MSDSVERLLVRIDATSEQLRREMKKADDTVSRTSMNIDMKLKKISKSFNDVGRVAAKWGVAVAAAGAAATTALVKSGLQSADALAKTSDKLGITTEALASMRFAAAQTGVETNKFDVALQRFTRRLADAAAGSGPAVKAFDALGLSASELVKLSPDQAFAKVADKMNLVANQSQKVSLAFKLFDSEGVGLVNTLALGSDGLAEMASQAEAAGLAISRIDAAKAEAANDAMARVAALMTGFSQQLAVNFAPLLENIADRLFGIGTEAGGMASAADKAFKFMAKGAAWFLQSIQGLQMAWVGMQRAFQEAARFIAIRFDDIAKHITMVWNKLPFVNKVVYKSALSGFISTMDAEIAKSKKRMDDILSQPLPTEAVEEYINDTTRQWEAQAITVQDAQSDVQGAMLTTEEVTKKLATTTKETAEDMSVAAEKVEDAWTKALQGTAERIDTAFANAWKGAFDSFDDFADGIKNSLKELMAELAHIAITRPIVMSIGGALGLGGAAGAAASGGSMLSGGGSLLSMLSGGASGALGSIGGAYTSIGNSLLGSSNAFLSGAGANALSIGRDYTYGSVGSGLMNAGLNVGAGFLGNYAGGQVFGQTSGIGSLAGGLAGSVFGPLGSGIGSFLGAGIEKGLGNVFGFGGKGGNQAGRADLDLSKGTLSAYGVGNSFDQANVDAAQELAQVLKLFSDSIGGSTAALNIKVGNRSGLAYNGNKFGQDSEAFLSSAIKDIIGGSTGLAKSLKKLIAEFDGTSEQTIAFAQAVVSMSDMIRDNPATRAMEEFAAGQEYAARGMVGAYTDQLTAIEKMIDGFDGSLDATTALNNALIQNKQAAYDMAVAIATIGESVDQNVRGSVNYFRESVRTPDEQLQNMQRQIEFWFSALPNMTDPGKIQQISDFLLKTNQSVFDAGPDDLQRSNVGTYIDFANEIGKVTQDTLAAVGGALQMSQDDLNTKVAGMLDNAAEGFQESANTMQGAAELFFAAVQSFVNNGNYNEVVA